MSKTELVLLPGMLLDAALFEHQAEHLAETARVQIGDITRDGSIEGMADTVLRQSPQRFALAGLSLGGIVALEILRQAPERVDRLALLDTNARAPSEQQLEAWRRFAGEAEVEGAVGVTRRHILPVMLSREDPMLARAVTEMAERVGDEAFLRQLAAQAGRVDLRGELDDIHCPTLVAAGRQDALCPPGLHQEIATAIPGAALVFVEDCGHLSSLEQPQAVTALLGYWLQGGA